MKESLFETLAKELSSEERMEMLERIRENLPSKEAPLHEEVFELDVDLKKIHKNAPWHEKLWIFIIHLFTGKEILEVTEDRQILFLQREMRREADTWVNLDKKRLKQDFYDLMDKLKNLAFSFKEPMDIFHSEQNDFILFLGHFSFPDVKKVIESEADPDEIKKKNPDYTINRTREKMQFRFDRSFEAIEKGARTHFKLQARSLYQLNALVQYPMHKLQAAFQEKGDSGVEAPWENCRIPLAPLNDILQSFQLFPENSLLEQLFIFFFKERILVSSSDEIAGWLGQKFTDACKLKDTLVEISNLPLNPLMKLITGNINYHYSDIGGGEDFFPIYKKACQEKLDQKFSRFSIRVRIEEVRSNLLSTWTMEDVPPLGRYNDSFSRYRSFRHVNSLVLLAAYYEELKLERGYPCMEIIWKRGEFYKKVNQDQYNEVMGFIQEAPGLFLDFASRLESQGYYGKQMEELEKSKGGTIEEDDRDVLFLYQTIDQEANMLVKKMLENLWLLGKLLSGILIGDRGEYDTLSNYADLSAPPNRQFKDELITREFQVNNSFRNITDLFSLEEKAPH